MLKPAPNENFIDCTFGCGGHSLEILKKNGSRGRVLGLDRDAEVVQKFKSTPRLTLVCGNFVDLKGIAKAHEFHPVHGILFDLGLSSWQLERSGRGFSFKKNEPLLMNFPDSDLTAQEVVNKWPEHELVRILREYGEERYARRIAQRICRHRQKAVIAATGQLVDIIRQSVPAVYRYKRLHCATKTFQALRIAVNSELDNLRLALPQALDLLEPGGRLVVISFHSLEDRIAKHFFKKLKSLTKKPLQPTDDEIRSNSRSRSAKLRAGVKI